MRYDGASMASCPSCGADGGASGGACARCGARISSFGSPSPHASGVSAGSSLELDVPARKPQKAPAKKKPEAELSLELAVDPRSLIQPISSEPAPASGPRSRSGAPAAGTAKGAVSLAPPAKGGSGGIVVRRELAGDLAVGDVAFDARLLADFGDPPGHWLLSATYAWRVLRRQREIKVALVGRREEAARTAAALEDAFVAFAERAKPAAETDEAYAALLSDARRAEETLRSRDAVLAADQDAHNARLAAVASRLAALETELANAQGSERALATEIASNQGALGRAEAKLKRAESEVRAAAREGIGTES
jgi:hypothetical protein